jgi:hypothetical protein
MTKFIVVSGGGNSGNSRPADSGLITFTINNIKPALVLVAQKIQTVIDFAVDKKDGRVGVLRHGNVDVNYNYLYFSNDGSAPIYTAIKDAKFSVEQDKPCYEADGKTEVDASVATKDGSICVSVYRLTRDVKLANGETRKALTQADMRVQIAGLLFHEISHKLGFNEEQAEALQNEATVNITDEAVEKGLHTAKYTLFQLGAAETKANDVIIAMNTKGISDATICTIQGQLQMRLQTISETLNTNPLIEDINILPAKDMLLIGSIVGMKAMHANLYCVKGAPGVEKGVVDTFKGKPSVNAYDLIKNHVFEGAEIYKNTISAYVIRDSYHGGLPAVKLEMEDIKKILNEIKWKAEARWNLKMLPNGSYN